MLSSLRQSFAQLRFEFQIVLIGEQIVEIVAIVVEKGWRGRKV